MFTCLNRKSSIIVEQVLSDPGVNQIAYVRTRRHDTPRSLKWEEFRWLIGILVLFFCCVSTLLSRSWTIKFPNLWWDSRRSKENSKVHMTWFLFWHRIRKTYWCFEIFFLGHPLRNPTKIQQFVREGFFFLRFCFDVLVRLLALHPTL